MIVDSPTKAQIPSLADMEPILPMSKRARLMKTVDGGPVNYCHRTLEEVEFAALWFHSLLH